MEAQFVMHVVGCIISIIGFPLTVWAIHAVYSQVQNNHVAPIFVINLLISNLIQLCCLFLLETLRVEWKILQILSFIVDFSAAVRVGFMLCAALERYLIIACPLWYQSKRTIKKTVAVCVLVWVLPAVSVFAIYLWVDSDVLFKIYSAFLLLPFPLLVFFLDGILKALCAPNSVPSDEKRQIVGSLAPELLIYSLFLPRIIWFLTHGDNYNDTFDNLSLVFVQFIPLADVALYVPKRRGTTDKPLASVCCSKTGSADISRSKGVHDDSIFTVSCVQLENKQKEKFREICHVQ